MTFSIDDEEIPKLRDWLEGQHAKMLEKGGGKMPYMGAIAGAYTYSFTDTTIGRIVSCSNSVTGDSIDLSGLL